MPTLIIKEPGSDEPKIVRSLGDQITIGRHSSNSVHLKSHGVSRQHAKIVCDGSNFFLVDLNSGNGTELNGMPLSPNEKNLLKAGDIITIDEYQINFHEKDDVFDINKSEDITESDILEVKLLKKVLGAIDKETVPSIEVLNGSAEGKKFYFTDETTEIVIGRDPECDFPINEHVISRKHARISKRWGGIGVRDLESKNGTFLNNRRIVEEYLHDGDRIALGTIVIMFRNPQEINLATLEDIRPKNKPAQIRPEEIPGIDEHAEGGEVPPEEAAPQPEGPPESALEEWEELEREGLPEENYPMPVAPQEKIKTLTPLEIGLIGLGVLILIFAMITVVNLMSS
jgi:pSer/pThr/pTyr-binding forkhead associated (FHA) protein